MARHGFDDDNGGFDETPPQGTPQYGWPADPASPYGRPQDHGPTYGTQQPTQQYPRYDDQTQPYGYPRPYDETQRYDGSQRFDDRGRFDRQYDRQYDQRYDDEYLGDAYEEDVPSRRRPAILIAAAVSVLVLLGLGGWALLGGDDKPSPTSLGETTDTPADGLPTTDPAVTTSAAPTTTKKATPKPTVKQTPKKVTKPAPAPPPPPPKKPDDPSCITYLPGSNAAPSVVKSKLEAAAAIDYFNGVIADPNPPPLSISPQLLKAVAFVESSWRSTVIACDGGVGLMQIMGPTRDFVNQRFGHEPPLDEKTLDGNIAIGAHYLEYLLYFFGVNYFENDFSWDAQVPRGEGGAMLKMRDLVIAAYNFGPEGCVMNRNGTGREDDVLYIPNPNYLNMVNTAEANSPWTTL